jgi:hypothetical protein
VVVVVLLCCCAVVLLCCCCCCCGGGVVVVLCCCCVVLLLCWCAGVLVCWCAGVLVCWCAVVVFVLLCCCAVVWWCGGVVVLLHSTLYGSSTGTSHKYFFTPSNIFISLDVALLPLLVLFSHLACEQGRTSAVVKLIALGANTNVAVPSTRMTPLHLAASTMHGMDSLRALVNAKVS